MATTNLAIRTLEVAEVFPARAFNQAVDEIDSIANGLNSIALGDTNETLTQEQVQHYGILEFTGTQTAVREITFPAGSHFWYIRNSTTHRLDLKYSGGASLSLPRHANAYWIIWADGTDFHLLGGPDALSDGTFNIDTTSLSFADDRNYETANTVARAIDLSDWWLGSTIEIDVNDTGTIDINTVGTGSVTVLVGALPATTGAQVWVMCVNADETNPDFLVKVQ